MPLFKGHKDCSNVKQVATQMLNSTVGKVQPDMIEQTVTNGFTIIRKEWNEKEKK